MSPGRERWSVRAECAANGREAGERQFITKKRLILGIRGAEHVQDGSVGILNVHSTLGKIFTSGARDNESVLGGD